MTGCAVRGGTRRCDDILDGGAATPVLVKSGSFQVDSGLRVAETLARTGANERRGTHEQAAAAECGL